VTDAATTRRRVSRRVLVVVLAAGGGIVLALAAIYVERRQIARQAVGHWLAARGVPSETEFAALEPGRLVGRIRIGSAQAPDLTVARAEVHYSLLGLFGGRGVQVTDVVLSHPVLKAQLRGGRFSAGALDPVINELLRQPPKPGEPHPRIIIDDGQLTIVTDYGVLIARASARVEDNKLAALDAVTAPGRYAGGGVEADVGAASLKARTSGGRIAVGLNAPVTRLAAQGAAIREGQFALMLQGAYPDLDDKAAPVDGQGWASLTTAGAEAKDLSSGRLRLVVQAPRLRFARDTGALDGDLRLFAVAEQLKARELVLTAATVDATGPFTLGQAARAQLQVRGEARGGWTGLGPAASGEPAEVAALRRSARAFHVRAEGLAVTAGPQLQARLTGPVRLRPDAGGELTLTPHGGGYRLTSAGGALPRANLDVRRVSWNARGVAAEGSFDAALSAGPAKDAHIAAAGALRVGPGGASFTASRCVDATAGRLAFGETALERLSARVCPLGKPLFSSKGSAWQAAGRVEAVSADLPAQQIAFAQAAGDLRAAGAARGLTADVTLASAQVRDTAAAQRFASFAVSGQARLDYDRVTGGFDARLGDGPVLAHADLRHDLQSGEGSAEIATGKVTFAPNGLQPTALSPLAEPFGKGVGGTVAFFGALRWTASAMSSQGLLELSNLDFMSPAGQVSGLSGSIRLSSLAPPTAPPGQTLTAREIAAALPLTDVTTTLELKEKALVVTGGAAHAGGGRVDIDELVIPLEAGQPMTGVLRVEDVQLHDLVEASPFADKVDLNARVTGRIPFSLDGDKISVSGGDLHAIAPGRLTISRTALASISAEGAAPAPVAAAVGPGTDDTITDFAYQALENLAFNKLDAGLTTRPDGRLAVLFHIVGRHDPPQHQEISISWTDLIRRRFVGRKLPLPSDTGVDLTLDTSLNVNDLLRDYANYQRLRSSPPVQR
jgi:hypothetical protein